MEEYRINIFDFLGAFVLIIILLLLFNFYKNSKVGKHPEYKYFTYGLSTKLIGAVSLAVVYVFYYGGGDTQTYFNGATVLADTLFSQPKTFIKLLFSESNSFSTELQSITNNIAFSHSQEEWFMVKITSFFTLISFNRYLISSIFISLIAFYGSWKMFKSFIYFFPKYHKAVFISIFLLPSVIFWSSGILKDNITFATLGIFFYQFIKIFFKNRFNIFSFIILIGSALIIFKLKAYIILGFMPGLFIALFINYKERIKNNIIRKVSAPILFVFIAYIGYFLITNMLNDSNKYKINTLEDRVNGFHSWHTTQGGSSYSLGDFEYTPIGIASKIPESLNITFFRPYIYEATNITSLLGAIESSVLFILFLIILWKYRLKWIIYSFKDSFLTLCFVYSIVFGFAVGFTSYNFGALARYKIPVMPFFVFLLLYFYYKNKFKTDEQN